MSIFDTLAQVLGYTKTQPIDRPVSWQMAEAEAGQWSIPPLTLPAAQAELYQRLTWVQIAIASVASTAATAALNVFESDGEDETDVPNHPFEKLLQRPNPLQSRYEFLESIFAHRALTGNAYVWLNRTNANQPPSEMWVIPSHVITPVPDENMYLRGYIYHGEGGQEIPLELHEIAHFKRFHPLNQFVGLSPVEALATVAVGDMAMSKWSTNFFDKDNAKVPGLLAFSDPIPDSDWERLKGDINNQHGGTRRRLMMLRNVGKGGVEWVSTAMSQSDMQFLQAREANRSEIFAMFAPGLDSVLAINATEANALAGKRTFIELAVWPAMTAVAEKFTNDVLPSYGPNLRARFEDIRVTDKAMGLAEQNAFSAVGTIDEIRQRFYQLDPIGDNRGNLLLKEIGAASPFSPAPTMPDTQTDESTQGMDDVTQGTEDTPEDDDAKAADLARFRRWAKKRTNPDPDAFKSAVLSHNDKAAILYDILTEDADGEMPPFSLPSGELTHDAVKRALIDDADAEEAMRRAVERRNAQRIRAAMQADAETIRQLLQRRRGSLESITEWVGADLENAYLETRSATAMQDALRAALIDSSTLGVTVTASQFETVGYAVDWTLTNLAAREWAHQYAGELITRIDETTRRGVRQAITQWVENGEPLPRLIDELEPLFGRKRADLIAVTETTNAFSYGNRQAMLDTGTVRWEWSTADDEKVCQICGPLHGAVVQIDTAFNGFLPDDVAARVRTTFQRPPAHPNCRCRIFPVIEEPR